MGLTICINRNYADNKWMSCPNGQLFTTHYSGCRIWSGLLYRNYIKLYVSFCAARPGFVAYLFVVQYTTAVLYRCFYIRFVLPLIQRNRGRKESTFWNNTKANRSDYGDLRYIHQARWKVSEESAKPSTIIPKFSGWNIGETAYQGKQLLSKRTCSNHSLCTSWGLRYQVVRREKGHLQYFFW